jgi:hypothetical protein
MALATLLAVLWAVLTYYHTTQAQNEAQATAALQESFRLAAEDPNVAPFERKERWYLENERDAVDPDQVLTEKYEWGAKHAMLAADSAYQLAGQGSQPWEAMIPGDDEGILADEEWKASLRSLAGYHDTYLLSIQFPCEQHSAEFKEFLRQRPPHEDLCLPADNGDRLAKKKLQEAAAAQNRFFKKNDSYT